MKGSYSKNNFMVKEMNNNYNFNANLQAQNGQQNIQNKFGNIEEVDSYIQKGIQMLNKAEGRLETLEKQLQSQEYSIRQLGIEPENLESEIQNLTNKEFELFLELNKLVPKELIDEMTKRGEL